MAAQPRAHGSATFFGRSAFGATKITHVPIGRVLKFSKWAFAAAILVLFYSEWVVGDYHGVAGPRRLYGNRCDDLSAEHEASVETVAAEVVTTVAHGERRLSEAAAAAGEESSGAAAAAAEAARGEVALASSHGASSASDETVTRRPLNSMLSMVLLGFVLCLGLDHVNTLMPARLRFPISCIIFLAGVGVDAVMKHFNDNMPEDSSASVFLYGHRSLSYLDPHALFYVILPILLYEGASNMQWHVLRKVLPSSILLAFPGVVLNLVLTGVVANTFLVDPAGNLMDWKVVFLLATILSATDPVAVVSALRSLGAPAKLSSVIDGESLLNDGSAYVVFLVFQDMVMPDAPDEEKMCPGSSADIGCVVGKFFQLALGGVTVGLVCGGIMYCWIKYARFLRGPTLELAIILVGVYGTFFLAEVLNTSGVLAEVIMGMVSSAKIQSVLSEEAHHAHHLVVSTIAYLSDKMIFFAAGMISVRFIREPAACGADGALGKMFGGGFLLYLLLHVVRAIVVAVCAPLLKRWGYGLTMKEGVVLVYGGLRGALGLAMGLVVEHNHYIAPRNATSIGFYVSFVVFMTLVVNGSTVDELYRKLRPYRPNQYRIRHVAKQLKKVEVELQHADLRKLQRHWFFNTCSFELIFQCVPNFSKMTFNDYTGLPVPFGIVPIRQVLRALEVYCYRKASPLAEVDREPAIDEPRNRLTRQIAEGLNQAVSIASTSVGGTGDILENVLDVDDASLEFRRLDSAGKTGVYISRRPLAQIVGRNESSFSVQISELGKEAVMVGLISEIPNSDAFAEQVLGSQASSLFVDCSTSRVFYNMGEGLQCLQDTWRAVTTLRVHKRSVTSSEVIGKKLAGEVFVGYRVGSWIRLADTAGFVSVNAASASVPADATIVNIPSIPGERRQGLAVEAVDVSNQDRNPQSLEVDDELQVQVGRSQGQPPHIAFWVVSGRSHSKVEPRLVGMIPAGNFAAGDLFPVVEFLPNHSGRASVEGPTASVQSGGLVGRLRHGGGGDEPDACNTKITLSFRPEVADDNETLDEIFTTLFNTVMHFYQEQHHRGIIAHTTLTWLSLAASEAMDSAARETHSKRILDFRCLEATEDLKKAVEAFECPFGRARTHTKSPSSTHNVFAPIFVEYLCVKQQLSKRSWWDAYPSSWRCASRMRSMGYELFRTKVESLYAFIEGHEKVLEEFTHLERFPAVVQCLKQVLTLARQDVTFLEETMPRQLYLSQHLLLLKIVISKRLRKLEEEAEEGWLSSADAEPLVNLTHEQMAEIEMHMPLLHDEGEEDMLEGLRNAWSDTFRAGRANSKPTWATGRKGSKDSKCSEMPAWVPGRKGSKDSKCSETSRLSDHLTTRKADLVEEAVTGFSTTPTLPNSVD